MKNKKIKIYLALTVLAAIFVAIGKFVITGNTIPGLLIGIGAGLFGLSLAQIIVIAIAEKNPEYKRKASIEEKDERNIAINNNAKAKGFDAMGYILTILMLIFVFLNADLSIILLLVFAYLLVYGVFIFYLYKYSKEM
ncbi:hypothetical protein CYL18_04555 [Pradoshia eiseniae]|uniref:DUF2178 domain-containing protein n=1 Tax=Pradoshia eiseniae TaxID=2064768 RepID=A0A2S7N532_9BACI|nr:DUF6442 family protein [Pradoshia eiseniae]PQD97149.1 hypothetical protein CYL18_04555 [Pradoshia eiseniae]